jgi:hypothetical protein
MPTTNLHLHLQCVSSMYQDACHFLAAWSCHHRCYYAILACLTKRAFLRLQHKTQVPKVLIGMSQALCPTLAASKRVSQNMTSSCTEPATNMQILRVMVGMSEGGGEGHVEAGESKSDGWHVRPHVRGVVQK